MSRQNNPHQISCVHIADGFEDDCDELIHQCMQLSAFNYLSFCALWKEMNFGCVYKGRTAAAEVAELSEELILIAKHYMVKNTCNFEESVAGLFILYALLNLQPYAKFARVRIVPKDIPAINRIELVARRERRYDVLYILGSVLVQWSDFHAAERERGMEPALRKYLEGYTSIDKLGVRPKGVFYRQNEELDVIRELGSITRQYIRAKTSVAGGSSDPCLQYISDSLAEELGSSLKLIINGIVDEQPHAEGQDHETTDGATLAEPRDQSAPEHSDTVQSIKQKAMTNVVNPMRHLLCVDDRKKMKPISPIKKIKVSAPSRSPGKIKTNSPVKPKTSLPLNSKLVIVSPKKKNFCLAVSAKKTKYNSDSDSDVELNLKEFQKKLVDKNKKFAEDIGESNSDVTGESNSDVTGESNKEDGIQIGTMPVLVTPGDNGQTYEFEIIDECREKVPDTGQVAEASCSTAASPSGDKDTPGSKRLARTKKKDKKKTRTRGLKKREKKDFKRVRIKSTYKKMGLLAIANFSETGDNGNKIDDGHKSDNQKSGNNQESDDSHTSDDDVEDCLKW